jgi:arylformamidase
MPELIDVSVALDEALPIWPGSPGFQTKLLQQIDRGDGANVTQLTCDVHTGTHIDAPRHFVPEGRTIEEIRLDTLVGPAWVAHLPDVETITADTLDALDLPAKATRLLLRTRNSELWSSPQRSTFQPSYVALEPDAAQWIVDHGIDCVGIDYLSVQHYGADPATHRILLEAGRVIIEGLDLSRVDAGRYELLCMPVKLSGSDGAPARVALREEVESTE